VKIMSISGVISKKWKCNNNVKISKYGSNQWKYQ
jgi:hypothetical protein